MANRNFNQFSYSLEKKPVSVFAQADGGGAGVNMSLLAWLNGALGAAPSAGYKGMKSITRTADGDYTFNFQDNFQRLLEVNVTILSKDGSTAPLANAFYVKAVSPSAAGGATVRIVTYLGTIGTPVAPGTNDRWHFNFTWSDSSAQ